MTDLKPYSKVISRLRPALCLMAMASLSSALAQPEDSAATDRAASVAALKETRGQILASGLTPEEQIARMEIILKDWREAQARLLVAHQPQPIAAPAGEAAQAMVETQAAARSPQEAVQLIGELFRLNPGTFSRPVPPDAAVRLAKARTYLQSRTDTAADFSDALLEARQQAATPEESVRLVGELFKLNPQLASPSPASSR